MKKKVVWFMVSCLMVLSLVMASCGPAEEEEGEVEIGEAEVEIEEVEEVEEAVEEEEVIVEGPEVPQYGGTITLPLPGDPDWDLLSFGSAWPQMQAHQRLTDGNWAKGIAGGYGEAATTWGESTNIPELNTGYLAEDFYWEVSADGTEVTTTFKIREGVHFALFDSEASRMVGGREVTVDDIVWNWNQRIHNENAMNWQLYPMMRYPEAVKTGPNEFQVTHRYDDHLGCVMRENVATTVFPPELWDAYEYESCTDWMNSVGTGPYIITDYVPSNMVTMEKNPNYWMKDPVGPGMGNQLPYIEKFKYIIIPDASTLQAALRTGQLDQMAGFTLEDKDMMLGTAPDLLVAARGSWQQSFICMRTDLPPYNDVDVRRAMMMATDFEDINDSLYGGLGDIVSWPYFLVEGYELLHVGPDDADCPDSVKELYTYNPEGAMELLDNAGYPDGFRAQLYLTQDAADYYSIIQAMWQDVGIELELDVVEGGALIGIAASVGYDELLAIFTSPPSSYPEQFHYTGPSWVNASRIDDPYVNEEAENIRAQAITDFDAAMEMTRPLVKYLLDQAYVIPTPRYPSYNLWWPWLKNYSGEVSVGYFPGDSWVQWVWIDQELKESMGY